MGNWKTRTMAMVLLLTMTATLVGACTRGSSGGSAQDFYKGKTITWIISSEAGGDTDLLARAVAPYLAKETGATVKVDDMGSDEGVNYAYTQAKRDGLNIVIKAASALISNDILKAPGVQYDSAKLIYLADIHPASVVLQVSPKLPYQTLDELRQAKGLKAAATTMKGYLAIGAAVLIEVLGLDAKVITGYKGNKEATLAIARGEADFLVASDSSATRDEADGLARNFLVANNERSKVISKVPTMLEMGAKVPKELDAAVAFIGTPGYAVALPPEVPQDRVDYLREVFAKLSANQDVQKEIEKIAGAPTPFMSGKDLEAKYAVIKGDQDLAAQLDAILTKHAAVQ